MVLFLFYSTVLLTADRRGSACQESFYADPSERESEREHRRRRAFCASRVSVRSQIRINVRIRRLKVDFGAQREDQGLEVTIKGPGGDSSTDG